jgi:hypothetical protein
MQVHTVGMGQPKEDVMRGTSRKGMGRVVVVVAVIAALLSQGCVLEKKTITDVYTFVTGVDEDERYLVSAISFGSSYCIPPGLVSLLVKPDPIDPFITGLLVEAVVAGLVLESFLLPRTGKTFKGKFSVGEHCIAAGQALEWYVTPLGGAIAINAALLSKLKYQASAE